jgi:heme exporter protein C
MNMAGIAARLRITPFGLICLVGLVASLYLSLIWAPRERVMGDVQRIMYFHVASAWIAEFAFVLVGVSSVIYLWLRERRWDIVAYSAAEVGFVFCCFVMITGPIWGKPVWGTWWTWDPRLTMTLVLWLIYAAYVLLRVFAGDTETVARYAAVLGIVGVIDIPLIYLSIRLWRGIHPRVEQMAPEMAWTLLVCTGAFVCVFTWLLRLRVRSLHLHDEIRTLRQHVMAVS